MYASNDIWCLNHTCLVLPTFWSRVGFFGPCTTGIWGQIILCWRGCSVHRKMWAVSWPLLTSSLTLFQHVMMNKNASQHCPLPPVGQNCPQLRTTGVSFSGEFLISSEKYYFLKPCFTFLTSREKGQKDLPRGSCSSRGSRGSENTLDETSEKLGFRR